MNLTPREKDKLLISLAAIVARNRLERGVKLNHPEVIAIISDFVIEGARDGKSVAKLMEEGAKIISPERFICGEYVWIGERVIVDASGGLEIGDHTTLSGCSIWTHSSAMANILMDNKSGSPYNVRSKTSIGSGCFIGGPSVIYPGVSIGNRCIVMPMSVVNSDVPDNTMVGGSPAKMMKTIDEAYIERFKATLEQEADGHGEQ